jgi:hypothetical protein
MSDRVKKCIHGRKISQFLNYIRNTPGYAQETAQNWRFKNRNTLKNHFDIEDPNLAIHIHSMRDQDTFLLEFKYLSGYKVISFDLPDDINRIINSYARSYLHVTFSIQYNEFYRPPTCTLYALEHTIPNVYINMVDHYTYLINMYTSLKRPMFITHFYFISKKIFPFKKTLEETVLDIILLMDRNHFKYLGYK